MTFSFTERLKIKPVAGSALASLSFVFHLPAIIHDEWHKQIFNRHNSNLKGELGIRGDPGKSPQCSHHKRPGSSVGGGGTPCHPFRASAIVTLPVCLCFLHTDALKAVFLCSSWKPQTDSQQHPGNQHKPLDPMLVSVVHQLLCGVQLQWTV